MKGKTFSARRARSPAAEGCRLATSSRKGRCCVRIQKPVDDSAVIPSLSHEQSRRSSQRLILQIHHLRTRSKESGCCIVRKSAGNPEKMITLTPFGNLLAAHSFAMKHEPYLLWYIVFLTHVRSHSFSISPSLLLTAHRPIVIKSSRHYPSMHHDESDALLPVPLNLTSSNPHLLPRKIARSQTLLSSCISHKFIFQDKKRYDRADLSEP
ncbi:hypothetical protein BV25DRAFT_423386 [Artomyces pyxidatus]|uniref:Uncharacterized protein n=1 Tax=Artomyces pyxidatus TaxID=48021 RepID=A0ACB8T5H9_9AGAM|nr:hypothetical protein BV25DRAFT_423386 [Artomyces pyxidatus]